MRIQKGYTLIEIMIVIAIIAIINSIAIPDLTSARRRGNEASAISSLRTIVSAENMFHADDRGGEPGVADYATSLAQLGDAELVDEVLASGAKQGYCFILVSHDPLRTWHSHADPVLRGTSGDRSFYVDETGILRETRGGSADASSPAIHDDDIPPGTPDERPDEHAAGCETGEKTGNSDSEKPGDHSLKLLALLAPEGTRDAADKLLLDKNFLKEIYSSVLDRNDDLVLTFSDLSALTPDVILDFAESKVDKKNPGASLGNDIVLKNIIDWFLKQSLKALHLGIANETKLPSVPIDESPQPDQIR